MLSNTIVPQPTSLGPSKKSRQIGRALNTVVPLLLSLHTNRSEYLDDPDMLDTLALFAQSYSDVVKPGVVKALRDAQAASEQV
jgi:hypothetical protein